MKQKRTDLVLETHEVLNDSSGRLSGINKTTEETNDVKISRVIIENEEGEKLMNKPKGSYITLELPDITLTLSEDNEKISLILANELKKLLNLQKDSKVLVVGLGNRYITPDSLGPKVISKIMVTRHLFQYVPSALQDGMRSVSAISPGVLGITGIETVETVKAVTEKIKPDALIIIDALAAMNIKRIASTIQICDTGINPGAGVGNDRKALNKDFLGVPVIAIGIPTVVDAVTITSDAIDSLKENLPSPLGTLGSISYMDESRRYETIKESTDEELANFIVTPKDIDILTEKASRIVADGINLALHENITLKDTEAFLS